MQIPKTEKEANQIVIHFANLIRRTPPQSVEWQDAIYDIFTAMLAFDQDERFGEHSETLMDILLLRGREAIIPLLSVVAAFPEPEEFVPVALKVERFILAFKHGTALSETEVWNSIMEAYGDE